MVYLCVRSLGSRPNKTYYKITKQQNKFTSEFVPKQQFVKKHYQ